LAIDGQISMGAMIASNVLMTRALAPIDMMVSSWRQFIGMRAAFARLESLLMDYPPRDTALKRVAPEGQMTLRDVTAVAPARQKPILQDINFEVPGGSVLVILGPSGSGKSTLARVLVGIWPNVAGEVLLDGLPIEGWNRIELGPHLGYLPQDIELFEGSIAENIARFGEVDAEQVIDAAQSAGLHEMILRFPKGYDTPIGEAGSLLSGGQRQRIGLARAIYGNPSLVVLDEPNSSLDEAGDAALSQAILTMKSRGTTFVVITHRTSVLSVTDRLLLLRDGTQQLYGPTAEVMQKLNPAAAAVAAAPTVTRSA
jgi:ATP-binding cassette subfamily C exporter for protease/lipase